jgi:membrane protein required for colicin V production
MNLSTLRSFGILDLLIALLLVLFLIHGIRRGFIRSLFSLLALAAGWVVASRFHVALAARWSVAKPEAEIALRLGVFVLLFVITALLVRLVGQALTGVVKGSPLGLVDRLIGGLCGLGIGAIFLGVLFLVTSAYLPGSARPVAASRFYRPLTSVVRVLALTLPEDIRTKIRSYEWRAPDGGKKDPGGSA